MRYYFGSEEEPDKTADLEEEELSGAVDDQDDDEDEPVKSSGEILFRSLCDYGFAKGAWENLRTDQQEQYQACAEDLDI